jgi:hypothetical protein
LTPLEPHELKADFNSKGPKKYVNKSETGKQEIAPSVNASTKPIVSGVKPKAAYVKI